MADNSCHLTAGQCGKWLCIDGTKPHLSEPFSGTRYSVVAFLHNNTSALSAAQRQELLELGFKLPPDTAQPASGPKKIVAEDVDVGVEPNSEPKPLVSDKFPEPPPKRFKRNLQVGEQQSLSDEDKHQLETHLEKLQVTGQKDQYQSSGSTLTLGVERHQGEPRVTPQTRQYESLLKVLLDTLNSTLGNNRFRCTTIRIDKNYVSRPHILASPVGLALVMLLGNYTGGTFRSTDGTVSVNQPGTLTAYNPKKTHLSEHFSGTRYAITYYYHGDTKELNKKDYDQLRALGFPVTLEPSLDPLTIQPGTETHLVPPEQATGAEEPDNVLLPSGMKPSTGGLRGLARVRRKFKVKPTRPYAGGSARSQKLLENVRQIIRNKQTLTNNTSSLFAPLDTVNFGDAPHASERATSLQEDLQTPQGPPETLTPGSSSAEAPTQPPKRARTNSDGLLWKEGERPTLT